MTLSKGVYTPLLQQAWRLRRQRRRLSHRMTLDSSGMVSQVKHFEAARLPRTPISNPQATKNGKCAGAQHGHSEDGGDSGDCKVATKVKRREGWGNGEESREQQPLCGTKPAVPQHEFAGRAVANATCIDVGDEHNRTTTTKSRGKLLCTPAVVGVARLDHPGRAGGSVSRWSEAAGGKRRR